MNRTSARLLSTLARALRLVFATMLALATLVPVAALDSVSVTAPVAVAYETGLRPGTLRFTRSGSTGSLTIHYTVAGTAVAGTNYTALAGTVDFIQGDSFIDVPVVPLHDPAITGRLTVSVSITPDPTYIVGTSPGAQVTIADSDSTAMIEVPAAVADEDSAIPLVAGDPEVYHRGVMRVVFTPATPAWVPSNDARTVSVNFSGAGVLGTDYSLFYKISADANSGFGSTANGRTTTGQGYFTYAFLRGQNTIRISAGSAGIAAGNQVQFDGDSTIYTFTSGTPGTAASFVSINPVLQKSLATGTALTILGGATPPTGYSVLSPDPAGANTLKVDDNDAGGGGLYVGDTFTLPADDNQYVITAVSAGLNAPAGHFGTITFVRFVSATVGAGLGEVLTSSVAVSTVFAANNAQQNILVPYRSIRLEFSIEPKSTGVAELSKNVLMTLLSSLDYQLTNPTVGTVTLAQRDVIVNVSLGANAGKPNTAGSFLVTLNRAFATSVTVPYTIASTSTAVAGTDFVALPGSIDIPAGMTSQSIPVTPLNTPANGLKTLTISLDSTLDYKLAGSGSSGTNPSATVNITDAIGTVSVAATTSTAIENPTAPTPGVVTVSIIRNTTGSPPIPVTGAVNVGYTVSGSAVGGTRYTALTGTVTIPNGQNSAQIVVNPIDDIIYEGTQSVVITLAQGQGYAINGASSLAQVNINDDEPALSIARTSDATRPSTAGVFTVTYPGVPAGTALNRQVVVPLTFTGTAVLGVDFTAPASVTIPAGSRSASIVISPLTSTSTTAVTVIATMTANASYGIVVPSATLTIQPQGSQQPQSLKPDVGSVSTTKSGGCGRGGGLIVGVGLALYLMPNVRLRRRR